MKRFVSADSVVPFDGFPYDFKNWNYDENLLRSVLYYPSGDPEFCNDKQILVMDYDGFCEWFPEWVKGDELFEGTSAEEYIPYHIGRTIDVLKGVIE